MSIITRNALFVAAISAMAFRAPTDGEGNQNAAAGTAPVDAATNAAQLAAQLEVAKQALHTNIKAKFDNQVDIKETSFHFRKVKDEKSGVETKRPTLTIPVPYPSVEGIVSILEKGGKGLDLLLEAVGSVIVDQAREYINSNESASVENFPYDTLGWDYIANLPKAERRGGGISKEVWEDFAKDYVEIMPGITGKSKEQVELASKVFVAKLAPAKTNKQVLRILEAQLAIYANNTQRGEEFLPCIEFLNNKIETLLKVDEAALLNNL